MPAQAALVLKDAASPQVDHTFAANGSSKSADQTKAYAEWIDRSPTYRLGHVKLREQMTTKPNANGLIKVRFAFEQPIASVPSGATYPVVDYTNFASVEFMISEKATNQQIDDLRTHVAELLYQSFFSNKLKNREVTW